LRPLAKTRLWVHAVSSVHVLLVGPKNGSAAIADAKSVLAELDTHVVVARIAMAGPRVAADLMLAISNHRDADAVLVVRGGGPASDLDAFDTPAVVEAIAAHPVPIVAGIGHATNTTAFDMAVWRSAPTPSLAARIIVDLRHRSSTTRSLTPARGTAVIPRSVVARPKPVSVPAPGTVHHRPMSHTHPNRRRAVTVTAVVAALVVLVAVGLIL